MLSSVFYAVGILTMFIAGLGTGDNALTPAARWFAEVIPPMMDATAPVIELLSS